jgi:amino acid adenylation domain-containing protein/non-ribosomal peptide synthase protein (TIGR01720 family)
MGENAAYVIYTSGSTGKPKGVVNRHGGIRNRLLWMQDRYRLGREDGVLQKTAFSFDVSVWEFFWPLMTGARLVLARPGGQRDSGYLVDVMRREGVTVVHFVPSMLARFMEEAKAESLGTVREVICSGEALGVELMEEFLRGSGGARLHNLYGPTEAAVDVTWWECKAEEEGKRGGVRIGRPIANTQMYVLDEGMEPVGVGIRGELYIGGAGLGRGYLGKADLTAERFVPSRFGGKGERLYRTGDIGQWDEEGNLEYVGRVDEQVKVRGYRIELGEIEVALREIAGVGDAVVVAREEGGGEKRLVAYVTGGGVPGAGELRRRIGERLPEYMVPAVFVKLEAFPLTANGKLDRKALPLPGGERRAEGQYVGPRTPTEELLCGIWEKVLRVERVGIEDNFFELGGDSILSIQIVASGRRAGLQMTVQQIFRYQTVGALAGEVSEGVVEEQELVEGVVPLTPIQEWFFEQGLAEPWHFNQSVMLRVPEGMEAGKVAEALRELVEEHDALRLRYRRGEGGRWEQAYGRKGDGMGVRFEQIDVRGDVRGKEKSIAEEAERLQGSLNLESGPLVCAGWFEMGNGERRLLVVVHHLVMDGVSWRIVLEDLRLLCEGVGGRAKVELGYRSSSYGRWARQLREYAGSGGVEAEAEYWKGVVGRKVGKLPRDSGSEENTEGCRGTVEVGLRVEETEALLKEVPRAYRTQIQEVLVTALARALAGWSGERGVLLELEGHGREELFEGVDISRTVGWFTTLYPVYVEVTGKGIGEDLKAVKEQLRAVPGRGLGYGVLRYLHRHESLKTNHPEVVFNYLGQLDQVFDAGAWQPAAEYRGRDRSANQRRPHLLAVNGAVNGGRLHLNWEYSQAIHRKETIMRVAENCIRQLREIIAHSGPAEDTYTPADFPLAALSQDRIDKLAQRLRTRRTAAKV